MVVVHVNGVLKIKVALSKRLGLVLSIFLMVGHS